VAPGCIVDRAGQPSVEPADFYDGGALLAFGEHKGSGMSMLIELTAGLVSKMGTSCDPEYLGGNGALILALDIAPCQRRQVLRSSGHVLSRGEAARWWPQFRRYPSAGRARAAHLRAPSCWRRVGPRAYPSQITELASELGVDVGRLACHERSVEGRGPDGGGAGAGLHQGGSSRYVGSVLWRCDPRGIDFDWWASS